MTTATRLIQIREGILSRNDAAARRLRQRFQAAGVLALNWVSSPGSGKTALLERVLRHTQGHQARASELLGISRNTLRQKMRSLGFAIDKVFTQEGGGEPTGGS